MSDPVESRDVEDVLASIRKLVSVDQPPAMRRDRSRLVLTSELRVEDEDHDTELAPKEPKIEPRNAASVGGAAGETFDDQDTTGADADVADLVSDALDADASSSADRGEDATEGEAIDDVEPVDSEPEDDTRLEDETISAIEAAIASSETVATSVIDVPEETPVEDEPDEVGEIDYDEETAQATTWLRGVSGASDASVEPAEDAAEEVSQDEAQSLRRHPYRHSAARPAWADEPGPDEQRDEDQAEPAQIDPADAETMGAERHDRAGKWDSRGGFDLDDGEDAYLDEEALRDLVAEVVREELAGALGERITRNVKKLVRREIMRALAARDFE